MNKLWYALAIIISLMFAGILVKEMEDIPTRQQEYEASKWYLGETRYGIKFIQATNNFWDYELTFICQNETFKTNTGSAILFPNDVVFTVKGASGKYGYVIVELISKGEN